LSNSFGEDFVYASKRRHGGKVEIHSDMDSGGEAFELEKVVIAVVRGERNQEQQAPARSIDLDGDPGTKAEVPEAAQLNGFEMSPS